MKKLIEANSQFSKYEFTHNDSTRIVVYEKDLFDVTSPTPDFELISDIDHQKWLEWMNVNEE
jgi:hypothetical protein